ncbi:heat shock factor protein isoform X2 [Neocloeon triangulifer]|uniref:heat shock factor protein isoform X2 n=1 Tax=Neocloeon triangulifer TaxID=2078957 RepID=UPI00286FA49A|nr:heat shock factor protein isoform X2 [Neocloeon triangulifer]
MHSISEVSTNVPAFLAKLWKLVEDTDFDELICWSEAGDSFIIHNQAQFCRELLPLYYKHNNMASFVRQLNMYGFHKKVNVEAGGLKVDRDEMEFAHPFFVRQQPQLLERIKRKIAEPGRGSSRSCPEALNKVLGDVKQVKGRQESLDGKLGAMKRENEALWRELAVLRQKHLKQQQIVNKLIQFLLTVVQSPNRLNVKRRVPPLMLNDKDHHHHHHHHKHHKHSHGEGSPSTSTSDSHISISAPVSPAFMEDTVKSNDGKGGPTIHELDPSQEYIVPDTRDLDEEDEEEEEELGAPSPAEPPSPSELGLSFESAQTLNPPDLLLEDSSASSHAAPQQESKEELKKRISDLAIPSNGGNVMFNTSDESQASITRWGDHPLGEELDNHVDQVQNDLEGLKELLQGDNYSLDANTLLSLFADDPLSLNMGLPAQDKDMGNEMIAYNPTLFDLADENNDSSAVENSALFDSDLSGATLESLVESELQTPNPISGQPDFSQPPSKRRRQ